MAESDDSKRVSLRKLGPSRKVRTPTKRRGSNPAVKGGRWVISHPWAIVALAATVWFAFWVVGTRQTPHKVKAAFPTAFNIVSGQDVSIDGLDAGKVSKVTYDKQSGRSIVELGIDDEYWPLPQGTRAISRYGTTIGSGTRYVQLQLGPKGQGTIAENGVIATKDTRPAVDVDAVLNTATAATRSNAQDLAKKVDTATDGTEQDLNDGIAASGRGLKDIDGFLKDLGGDSVALSGLITNADRLTSVLASRSQQVQDLVSVSAKTFGAFASRTSQIQQTLDGVAPALGETRQTLARVDGSLGGLTDFVNDIRPGAKRLKPLAAAARPALTNLSRIVPPALSTVKTTNRVMPRLNTLLMNGTPFVSKVGRVTHELEPVFDCVRPYAPEAVNALGGLGSWVSSYVLAPADYNQTYAAADGSPMPYHGRKENGFYQQYSLRARPQVSSASLHSDPLTPEAYIKISGKSYAYPRPAGLLAGKPQYQPECHITKDSLDPSKDPEPKVGQ